MASNKDVLSVVDRFHERTGCAYLGDYMAAFRVKGQGRISFSVGG